MISSYWLHLGPLLYKTKFLKVLKKLCLKKKSRKINSENVYERCYFLLTLLRIILNKYNNEKF